MRGPKAFLVCAGFILAANACASGEATTEDPGSGGGGANIADGGDSSTSAAGEAGIGSGHADGGAVEAGPAPSGAQAIYVSIAGDDTAKGDTAAHPVKSIQVGLDLASKCGGAPCAVLIAAGTYSGAIQLREGVSVFGAYSPDFAARAATNLVTITSTEDRTVFAQSLTKKITIDGVTIVGADLTSNDGRSSYAFVALDSGSAVFIQNATIKGGKGADGAPGDAAPIVSCQSKGGAGGAPTDCSSGDGEPGDASGDTPVAGNGGNGGSNDCPSACPSVNGDSVSGGGDGVPGATGYNGAGGPAGASAVGTFKNNAWVAAVSGWGNRGGHGTGGGGGGGGGTKRFRACFGCGTLLGGHGGAGAPGGCAGGGGGPGGAGGGSFGIVASNSVVTTTNVIVSSGSGGRGAAGSDGGPGMPGVKSTDDGRLEGNSQKCGLINYSSAGGGHGASGGDGGPGGGGGGGQGGASVAIATIGTGSVLQSATTITVGVGGLGGPGGKGGGNPGADGLPGAVFPVHPF